MKMKTIEEKAKAYDEALNKCREFYETLGNAKLKEEVEVIFPELKECKESEDEKIKDAAIEFVRQNKSFNYRLGISKEEVIAWLEKQGEQNSKKVSIWKHWKYGIAGNGEGKIVFLIKSGNTYRLSSCLSFECDYIKLSDLDKLYVEKQNEQKPVVIISKFRVGDEIKTSNEESLTITKIDEKGYWSEDLFICGFDDADKWELVEQKPAWSEEDDKNLEKTIWYVEKGGKLIFQKTDKLVSWLKSLRPQNTWKPSEEQMVTLEYYMHTLVCNSHKETLFSLYQDLKKLREE